MLTCPPSTKINQIQIDNREPLFCDPREQIDQCQGKETCEIMPDCQEWDFSVTHYCDADPHRYYQNFVKTPTSLDQGMPSLNQAKSRLFSLVHQYWLFIIVLLSVFGIVYLIVYHLTFPEEGYLSFVTSSGLEGSNGPKN